MPELPEVETTRRGIEPLISGRRLTAVDVRQASLRWPIPVATINALCGERLQRVDRRGKYVLLRFAPRDLILHLGMSGSVRIHEQLPPPRTHDHVDLTFEGRTLRLNDPRRFGALLAAEARAEHHPLIATQGIEPLSPEFDGAYLARAAGKRTVAVKNFIMNGRVVVGVGNIYASEALFMAGIRPTRAAGRVSLQRYEGLAQAIRQVLASAIEKGGTTLRDFSGGDGKPGYFKQSLAVYDRQGEPCVQCGKLLRGTRLGQRGTVWCGTCQR